MALQEHEALEEALQSMWSCVKDMQDRLACAESTVGGRDALERQLSQVQVRGAPARHGCLRKTLSRFADVSVGSSLFCEPPREDYVGRMEKLGKKDLEGSFFSFVKEYFCSNSFKIIFAVF